LAVDKPQIVAQVNQVLENLAQFQVDGRRKPNGLSEVAGQQSLVVLVWR